MRRIGENSPDCVGESFGRSAEREVTRRGPGGRPTCLATIQGAGAKVSGTRKPFNLLRWFSLASLIAIVPVAGVTVLGLSHYITEEILERDAILTAQFISSIASTQAIHSGVGSPGTFARLLDQRVDPERYGVSRAAAERGRAEFLDHVRLLPDLLLGNIYAADRRIVWSTNPVLIGKLDAANDELEQAFGSRVMIARGHVGEEQHKQEQLFLGPPENYYIENYVPLLDSSGEVAVVVEVYKEPKSLFETIKRGHLLLKVVTTLATLLIYVALFSIVKRASKMLAAQEQRLVENETLVAIGEMSAAVAHGLRNPLATIRSSAELAIDSDPESVNKNANDIIRQVDRLTKWVRELLVFSRPVQGENQPVDIVGVLEEVMLGFTAQIEKSGVAVDWDFDRTAGSRPSVVGSSALFTQVFQSVIANAIEAMPRGGKIRLSLKLDENARGLSIMVGDTGCGMSEQNLAMAFKPFHTTKKQGLGVGLPLVRRIMERFGGEVNLRSREGVGTEVHLSFVSAA